MKYFHVIYNSSQKNFEGGIGFGFRTMSEGMPESYKQALYDNANQELFFIYKYGTYVYPSPSALFENRNKVLDFPNGYAFSLIKTNDGNSFYILERIIPVGFDYTYYLKNTPGRLGNYVVDCYIFPEIPSREVFEMLYENPGVSSNYFIPKSPVPDQGNEEMKALSLDSSSLLPMEDKPFTAGSLEKISDIAIELLFAYIESRKKGKKLIIKYPWKNTATLMADFMRLLPDNEIPNARFCTNYHYEGLQEAFQIICINEYYQYDVPTQSIFVDLGTGNTVSTKERDTYKGIIKNDIDANELDSVHRQVSWMLSSAYGMVADKTNATNRIIYSYCIDKSRFNVKELLENEEAIDVLKSYLSGNSKDSRLLTEQLCKLFMSCRSTADYTFMINSVNLLRSKGIDMSEVILSNKPNTTEYMLQSPETLAECIKRIGWTYLKEYVIKEEFEKHKEFAKEKALYDYWVELYQYFYSKSDLADKYNFVKSIFAIKLPAKTRDIVIDQQVDPQSQVGIYIDLINEYPDKVKGFYELLVKSIEKAKDTDTDFIKCFAGHISNPDFSKIFLMQFKRIKLTGDPLKMMKTLYGYIEKNESLKSDVVRSLHEISVYNAIYNSIKQNFKKYEKDEIIFSIKKYIQPLSTGIDKSKLLKWDILEAVIEENTDRIKDNFTEVYRLTVEMKYIEYYKKLFPDAVKKFTISDVVKDMKDIGLTESNMVKLALEIIPENKSYDYAVCIYKNCDHDFKFVYDYLTVNKVKHKEELLKKYYEKEYKSFAKKQKIKMFFSSIFSVFKRQKKS